MTLKLPVAIVQTYQQLLATQAPTVQQQAVLTRALFIQSTMGNLNELFTGNGFTATGVGGVIMPTSTEVIISPFNTALLPPGKGIDSVAFCLNGANGGLPSAAGTCTQLTPAGRSEQAPGSEQA